MLLNWRAHYQYGYDAWPRGMIIIGLKNIGAIFGKSAQTASRWITHHGLKAKRLPDKQWCTSYTWIDEWIAEGWAKEELVKNRTPKPIRPRRKKTDRKAEDNGPMVHSPTAD